MSDHQEHRGSILLVDDHRESLAALHAVLEPLGEQLVLAESGEQALRALLHIECSVILLDVRMAGLDGLQTARIIRSRPGTRHIPIIFMTAQASELDEIALAYESGAVDYVVKPFEPEILRAKVASSSSCTASAASACANHVPAPRPRLSRGQSARCRCSLTPRCATSSSASWRPSSSTAARNCSMPTPRRCCCATRTSRACNVRASARRGAAADRR